MQRLFVLVVVMLGMASVVASQDIAPDEITLDLPGVVPESLEYDRDGERFLLGTMAGGTVYSIELDGTIEVFTELDTEAGYVSSVGMHIDPEQQRLYVTQTDYFAFLTGEGETSGGLGAYDLQTGELLWLADLAALLPDERHFINDVITDGDGNAYVTDSLTPTIFRVDPDGNAEVFLNSEDLGGEVDFGFGPVTFTLNGLAYDPAGYLIVSNVGQGRLVRVPLDAPEDFAPIMLAQPVFADGVDFDNDGRLIVVNSATQNVLALNSDDEWQSATITGISEGHDATTSAALADDVYVIYAYLAEDPPPDEYKIVRIEFTIPE